MRRCEKSSEETQGEEVYGAMGKQGKRSIVKGGMGMREDETGMPGGVREMCCFASLLLLDVFGQAESSRTKPG